MPLPGPQDIPIEIFAGLATDPSATGLSAGMSPDCADIAFELSGAVKTRPGIQTELVLPANPLVPGGANVSVNYLKDHLNVDAGLMALYLDSGGTLWREQPEANASQIGQVFPNLYGKSDTQFAREWMAFSDGKFGMDIPRQYDPVRGWFDRVSQVGPGEPPVAADLNNLSYTIAPDTGGSDSGIAGFGSIGIQSLHEDGNTVTVEVASDLPPEFQVGDQFALSGSSVSTYDGTWVCTAIIGPTKLTYVNPVSGLADGSATGSFSPFLATITTTAANQVKKGDTVNISGASNATCDGSWPVRSIVDTTHFVIAITYTPVNAGGGTVAIGGSIAVGEHQLSVFFVTREGYFTKPAPPSKWTAAGNKSAVASSIPIGPPNVIARILIFTQAGGATFYYLPKFRIDDNSTTTLTVSFTDAELTAGTDASSLFNRVELQPCAGFVAYNSRMIAWGERNNVDGFLNLSFDGGFSNNRPLGWTVDPTNGAGGAKDETDALFGGAYKITGSGSAANRGEIYQGAAKNYLGTPILRPKTPYSVRLAVRTFGTVGSDPVNGQFVNIFLQAASGNYPFAKFALGPMTAQYAELTAPLKDIFGSGEMSTVPDDLSLHVYMSGNVPNTAGVIIDRIEIFPTLEPYNDSQLRVSDAFDPEAFDGVSGLIEVTPQDGERISTCYLLRGNLYIVKQRHTAYTADDGNNPPNKWVVTLVANSVGTESLHGVGDGEDWRIILSRPGAYITDGGEPKKLSQEIHTVVSGSPVKFTWTQINWAFAHRAWLTVDKERRRAYFGVPIGTSQVPNFIGAMDYRGLDTADQIAATPAMHQSTYSGKNITLSRGRRWCPWRIAANCGAMVERFDGTAQLLLGNNVANSKVYQLTEGSTDDDGKAINGYWTTYFIPSIEQEQMLQLGGHRKLISYLTMFVEGNGSLLLSSIVADLGNSAQAYAPITLSNPARADEERPLNDLGQRIAYRMETNAAGHWFRLQRFCPSVQPDPQLPVRGA